MMKVFQKKSKKGITLVESVIAAVVLGFAATGILTMLIFGGTKIFQIGSESNAYAEATQRMDQVIAAVSNGFATNTTVANALYDDTLSEGLSTDVLNNFLGFDTDAEDGYSLTAKAKEYGEGAGIQGWYLTLTYKDVTITAYASNSKGVFDS